MGAGVVMLLRIPSFQLQRLTLAHPSSVMPEFCSASFTAHVPFIGSALLRHHSAFVFPLHMHMAVISALKLPSVALLHL